MKPITGMDFDRVSLHHFLAVLSFPNPKQSLLRSCTILNKGLPKEEKSERKGVRKVELDGYGNHRQVRP